LRQSFISVLFAFCFSFEGLSFAANQTCIVTMADLSEQSVQQPGAEEIRTSFRTDEYPIPQSEQAGSHGEDHEIGQFGYKPELGVP
jgi:hypothetical protein